MSRRFVLVTATCVFSDGVSTKSAGIRKLKRGSTLPEFVSSYFDSAPDEILTRDGAITAIARANNSVLTWTFSEYPEIELLDAVRHLTREELLRDLKELLPLKEMVR